MVYTVSITSQGQISIPIKLRRQLDLERTRKAFISEDKGRIVIEPVRDLLDLGGSLKTTIKATPQQTRKAFEEYLAQEAIKGLK